MNKSFQISPKSIDWKIQQTLLYQEYRSFIFSIVHKILKDQEDSENLTQDIFIKAFDKIEKGFYKDEGFKNWIAQIARNQSIDFYRKQKRKPSISYLGKDFSLNQLCFSYTENEESFFQTPPKKTLSELISILDPKLKEVLVYRYVNGLTFTKIQVIISEQEGKNVPLNTVLGRMRYALNHIKKEVKRKKLKIEDLENQICFSN